MPDKGKQAPRLSWFGIQSIFVAFSKVTCDTLNSLEIVNRVQNGEFPPFRPTVSELITGVEEIRELMKQCWEESPDLRPDFHEIKKIMNKILTNNGM